MVVFFRWAALRASAVLAVVLLAACSSGGPQTPEEVVKAYLTAWRNHDYYTAYPLLTPYMQQDLSREAWATEQDAITKVAEVQIFSFQVFPARVEGDKATVPNLLKSKDKYINQLGKNEYELYTVLRSPDGNWRIDKQELVESDGVSKWFPESAREDR
jgi:hypothetical protein